MRAAAKSAKRLENTRHLCAFGIYYIRDQAFLRTGACGANRRFANFYGANRGYGCVYKRWNCAATAIVSVEGVAPLASCNAWQQVR